MSEQSQTASIPSCRPAGENFVWLTSMGLAAGLIMIVFLLGLIFWKGVVVFWPADVSLVETQTAEGESKQFAGVIVDKREKKSRKLDETGKEQPSESEYYIFTGNKDIYGSMYRYIDVAEVKGLSQPDDIFVAERLEYGDAVFYAKSLILSENEVILASEPDFNERLHARLEEVNERRDTIKHLEKGKIGKINTQIEKLNLDKRSLVRKLGDEEANATPKMQEIDGKLAILNAEYEGLAEQASALRKQQDTFTLKYQTASGEEREQPLGDFVAMHQPNAMNPLSKLGLFMTNLWVFLIDEPREANTEGGIFPAIFGTFIMTVLMSAAVMPFGVLAAIYLREYASQGPFVRAVRIAVNNLAGVPSIVYGVFGLGFFVYIVGGSLDYLFYADRLPTHTFGTGGVLWASLTLALMTVPVVVVAAEEALASVPRGMREASLACGASKWQTIQRIVLPAAAPGILTGLVLAMARGAGEVAPLMLVGVVKLAPTLPFDTTFPFLHMERKFMHLGFHIYDLGFQSPDSEAAKPMVFATTFLLILLVVVLNLGAILVRDRLRKKYASSTF